MEDGSQLCEGQSEHSDPRGVEEHGKNTERTWNKPLGRALYSVVFKNRLTGQPRPSPWGDREDGGFTAK